MRSIEFTRLGRTTMALVLVAGLAFATTACRETGAGSDPQTSPVDTTQPAPPRRGSR